nr:ribonuclease H-like domain-containing protein [Tanacetum cinerariifolium]
MALPEDHLAKFYKMADAKEMWEAIKSRFGGNDESKKMQKYLLKQQFECFSVSYLEGLHKGYDRSLPSSWSQVALIMRTNPGLDTLSFDDLYNNLREGSSSYTDEVIHSFSANQSSAPQLDYNDLEQINDDDIEEMDLKWQVAMISIRIKKFHKRTGRKLQFDTKEPVGFDKTKVECFNYHKMGHFARDCKAKGNQDSRKRDAGYNENKARDNGRRPVYQDDSKALVTIDGEDIDWSGHVEEDAQNYAMMAYSSSNSSSDNENSSKNLNRLLNTQMSVNDKFGLGYGDYRYGSILSYENEVLQSLFMNKESDLENTSVNDRYAEEMHVVRPPMTEIYMPSEPDVEIDYSKFTYGPKQTLADESDSKPSDYASCESDSSIETTTSMPEPIESAPKVVCEPKVWNDAPIIEEYESDSDNDSVSNEQEDKEKPSFAFIDYVKHVKTSRKNVKETCTPNQTPKVEKHDRNGHTRKGLGYDFTRKACFVCGSFSHLIRDYDFHEKRMAKQAALAKSKNKDDPHKALKDKGIVDSGCSRHMTGKKAHLADYQEFKGGSVAFGGRNGRITVLLKIPRQHNMYSFNLKNIDPSGDLACLFAKASIDESNKWHRRLGHVNFKNLNKLVKGNLVRGLPSKIFENDHTCVACQKRKQHKASCKVKTRSRGSIVMPKLHNKMGVAERKNRTLIKADRTMLAYSFLSTTFRAKAVNTACYILNKVLVTKPQNKTPYELLTGKQPIISYLKPFGCHVTILNTIDQLGKFDGKSDSGFLVGYSLNSKAFRIYNLETKRVKENLHVNFRENKPNVAGQGHVWMFDLD